MMGWKDNKNLGSWAFTKQFNKPSYNEGDHIATNESPLWLMEEGSNVPITPTHKPCGYWTEGMKGWYLRVTKSGDGTGVVTSDVPGIDCGSSCYYFFIDGSTVVLTATPDEGCSFVEWSGDGTGITARTVFMDGDKVVNAEFSAIPYACMIGWFKHNEGSGVPIIDYSPLAANGWLDGGPGYNPPDSTQLNYFWNTNPGFGTSNANLNLGAKTRRTLPNFNTGYISGIAFIKPLGGGFYHPQNAFELGETASKNYFAVGWNNSAYLGMSVNMGGFVASSILLALGTWYCIYVYSQGNANNNGLYIRKSGDSDWTQALINIGNTAAGDNQDSIYLFGGFNNPISMLGGDALYYACSIPSGIITLSQATNVYNALKSRHGMT